MKYYIIFATAAVIALGIVGVWAYFNREKTMKLIEKLNDILTSEEFKKRILEAMRYVEKNFVGTQLGQQRLWYVCGFINDMLPKELQPYITAELLRDVVNGLFREFATEKDGHRIIE
ncbi:MAG: hypothetical protein RR253_04025 [Oscillospiraceae bacterium]